MEIGRRIAGSIQRIQRKDNKSTGSHSSKKRGKILSGNRHIRTCNWRSPITRTRQQVETYYISIKNNATSRTELQDI